LSDLYELARSNPDLHSLESFYSAINHNSSQLFLTPKSFDTWSWNIQDTAGRSLDKNKILNGDILETIKDEISERGADKIKFQWIEAHTNLQTEDHINNREIESSMGTEVTRYDLNSIDYNNWVKMTETGIIDEDSAKKLRKIMKGDPKEYKKKTKNSKKNQKSSS
jgi:intergrase/recombinase